MDPTVDLPGVMDNLQEELLASALRLPLAALLGTVLALRPKRRGTPERQPTVVQTQIILAVVGALIMLVVGASLARAFGIVGAANLIRYRSKIDEVLRRYTARYELRTAAEDVICYMVTTPRLLRTDRVSNAIMELDPEGKGAVEWNEISKDKL